MYKRRRKGKVRSKKIKKSQATATVRMYTYNLIVAGLQIFFRYSNLSGACFYGFGA